MNPYPTIAHIVQYATFVWILIDIVLYWWQLIQVTINPKRDFILLEWYPVTKKTIIEVYVQYIFLTFIVAVCIDVFSGFIGVIWPFGIFVLYEMITERCKSFAIRQATIKEFGCH